MVKHGNTIFTVTERGKKQSKWCDCSFPVHYFFKLLFSRLFAFEQTPRLFFDTHAKILQARTYLDIILPGNMARSWQDFPSLSMFLINAIKFHFTGLTGSRGNLVFITILSKLIEAQSKWICGDFLPLNWPPLCKFLPDYQKWPAMQGQPYTCYSQKCPSNLISCMITRITIAEKKLKKRKTKFWVEYQSFGNVKSSQLR